MAHTRARVRARRAPPTRTEPEEVRLGRQATAALERVPGMVESILSASAEPLEEGLRREDLKW